MEIFDIFKKSDDFEKIETPKSYKFNEFHQLSHQKNENGIELNFNFNAIHNTETDINFILINTSDINDKSKMYVLQFTVKKEKGNSSIFENKIILGQGINPNDFGGFNFAKHLHKTFNWNTQDNYLRSLKATIDFDKSENFVLDAFLNKKIKIFVSDAYNQKLYILTLDWKNKRANIIIEKTNIDTFRNIYFVKNEEFKTEPNSDSEVKMTIKVKGFDKDGEPEIQILKNGSLRLVFEFMPPLNGSDDQNDNEIFENFDKELSKIIGKEIVWEDRETFLIEKAEKGDEKLLKKYLEEFWVNKNIS